jgi:polar amino acid transport system substrate-binding protein
MLKYTHFFSRSWYLYLSFFFLSTISYGADHSITWAGDATSGGAAPFVFPSTEDLSIIEGLDWDVMQGVSKILNNTIGFRSVEWDGLVPGLKTHNYDLIGGGMEISEERNKEILFSRPYHISYNVLAVKKAGPYRSLHDLNGKKIGVISHTLGEDIVLSYNNTICKNDRKLCVQILRYDDENLLLQDVNNDRLDAAVMDYASALYYGVPRQDILVINEPLGGRFIYYGFGINKDRPYILNMINQSLSAMIQNGAMRSILQRWNLWNSYDAAAWHQNPNYDTNPSSYEKFVSYSQINNGSLLNRLFKYSKYFPDISQAALQTLGISALSMVLAVFLGILLAFNYLYAPGILSIFSVVYVEVFRQTPLLIQLFFIYYALPSFGIRLSPFWAGCIGLGLNYAANECENYRAGISSISVGQWEAGQMLGLTKYQIFRYVVFPQAFQNVLPSITNDFIALLKDSSLLSIITIKELTAFYSQASAANFDYLGMSVLVAVAYFLLGLPFALLSKWVERKLSKNKKKINKNTKSNRKS